MKLDEIKATLARRRADFEKWGLDPDLAGGYAVITAINSPSAPFEVGEMLVLGGQYERELDLEGRKPGKWDLEYDWFGTDYNAALECSVSTRELK